MEDFEKLGVFYLGKSYDLAAKEAGDELLLYDSKDLVTHAVCVGMTGSGKTGLCIGLLEEAALDGIPAIVIDPKGDLGNLLLTFPELRPEDFRPWIDEEEANRQDLSPDDYAATEAKRWTEGLASWGQSGERIARLRAAADFTLYTPGSTAGVPVSILQSFAPPGPALRADPELLADRVATTATSVLALLGIDADPLQSREHILLSTVLSTAWKQGQDLDLPGLIQQIQTPPIERVGVLDLETFYPSKDRFSLAMLLNNLLAAPGFETWLQGDGLDVGRLLGTPEGRPRIAIFSIAHLSDQERMFFVSLLLNEVLGWVRSQPGTSSLRALVYMDEIFGYFPPVADPPSKKPLLTLLKQARAYGVGVVLATQNPVDLDYKGLGNTGTWFIGRLQTDRDKARVLEGLEGVAAGSTGGFDRQAMEETLAGLGKRVFLLYNVHEDAPVVFTTRWALSYLAGPLTREQIKRLSPTGPTAGAPTSATPPVSEAGAPAPPADVTATPPPDEAASPAATASTAAATAGTRPLLPPGITELFVPVRETAPGTAARYEPSLLGRGTVHITDQKAGVDVSTDVVALASLVGDGGADPAWAAAADLTPEDLETAPEEGAAFLPLPARAADPKSYARWQKDFTTWLYRTQTLDLLKSPTLKQLSEPGESEGDFRMRLAQAGRELRDQKTEELRNRFTPKLAALEERTRRAQQAVERETEQSRGAHVQTAISLGATLLGAFVGRKGLNRSTVGRATTAVRGVGRSMDQAGDVGRAKQDVEALLQQRAELEATFKAEVDALETKLDPATEPLETKTLRPKKSDIATQPVALCWAPQAVPPAG